MHHLKKIFHSAITKEQVIDQLNKKFKDNPQKVNEIINADPTPNKGYSIWIGKLLLSNNIILPEDTDKIIETLTTFEQLKKRKKIKGVDINQLNDYQELSKIVDDAMGTQTKGEQYQESLEKGQELIYSDAEFKVVKITTPEASVKLARGTKWCVKDAKYAEHYLKDGPLMMVFKQDQPLALLHEDSGQAKDVNDGKISEDIAKELAKIWRNLGIRIFSEELSSILDALPPEEVLLDKENNYNYLMERELISLDELIQLAKEKDDYQSIGSHIVQEARYFRRRLPQYESFLLYNPYSIYEYAKDVLKQRWIEAEPYILKDPYVIIQYVEYVMNGQRWPEAEEAILTNPYVAVEYCRLAIKKRWPEAEPIISTDGAAAFQYAEYILQERWPEAEPAILKSENQMNIVHYAEFILKGRWPEAEEVLKDAESGVAYEYLVRVAKGVRIPKLENALLKAPREALNYAKNSIKGRWPEAEAIFLKDPYYAAVYAKDVLKQRWPEAEPLIANSESSQAIVIYATEVLKDRWPEAEQKLMILKEHHWLGTYLGFLAKIGKDKDFISEHQTKKASNNKILKLAYREYIKQVKWS